MSERRNYAKEIVAATIAGDLETVAAIAHELAGKVAHDDDRRERQADKKRRQRAALSRDISGLKGTNADTPGQGETTPEVSLISPQTPINSSYPRTTHTPAHEAEGRLSAPQLAGMLCDRLGPDLWADVERFLDSRNPRTHASWLHEFIKLLGPAQGFTPEDLAGACTDALMLDIPLSGPYAVRTFMLKKRDERLGVKLAGTSQQGHNSQPAGAGSGEAFLLLAKIKRSKQEWRNAMPEPAKVALEAIGGYERVRTCTEQWWGALASQFAKTHAAALQAEANGTLQALAPEVVELGKGWAKQEEQEDPAKLEQYNADRAAAVESWRAAHPERVEQLHSGIVADFGDFAPKMQGSIQRCLTDMIAKAVEFPTFGEWLVVGAPPLRESGGDCIITPMTGETPSTGDRE
jgi:hypothetical protein